VARLAVGRSDPNHAVTAAVFLRHFGETSYRAVRGEARWWSTSGPALSVRQARHCALISGGAGQRRARWPPCGAAGDEIRTISLGNDERLAPDKLPRS
jgi:hypothetical protein